MLIIVLNTLIAFWNKLAKRCDWSRLTRLFCVCSSGDVKVGASSQSTTRSKKSPWTASTLAQEAKELTRSVRAVLEVDCKWPACPPAVSVLPACQRLKLKPTLRCERLSSPFQCWPSRRRSETSASTWESKRLPPCQLLISWSQLCMNLCSVALLLCFHQLVYVHSWWMRPSQNSSVIKLEKETWTFTCESPAHWTVQ